MSDSSVIVSYNVNINPYIGNNDLEDLSDVHILCSVHNVFAGGRVVVGDEWRG
jgi:hypothetical protein